MGSGTRPALLGLACLTAFFSNASLHAQETENPGPAFRQQPTPAWMDEGSTKDSGTNNSGNGSSITIADPVEPVDPDPRSGPAAPKAPGEGGRFKFTPPHMPDFSKFRQKATRMTSETTIGSATKQIEQDSFTGINLDLLGRDIAQLASAVASLSAGPERVALANRLAEEKKRFDAAAELQKLIPGDPAVSDTALKAASSSRGTARPALSRQQQQRVQELKRVLMPPPEPPKQMPVPPAPVPSAAPPAKNAPKADIPKQFHRPEGYRSFMRETLATRAKEASENTTEQATDTAAP
mgnify:CR=1 FL=1